MKHFVALLVLALLVHNAIALTKQGKLGQSRLQAKLGLTDNPNDILLNGVTSFANSVEASGGRLSEAQFDQAMHDFINFKESSTDVTDPNSFCEYDQFYSTINTDGSADTFTDYNTNPAHEVEELCSSLTADENIPPTTSEKLSAAVQKIARATGLDLSVTVEALRDNKFSRSECLAIQTAAARHFAPTLLQVEESLKLRRHLIFTSILRSTVAVIGAMMSAVVTKVTGVTLPGTFNNNLGAPNKIISVEQKITAFNPRSNDFAGYLSTNIKNLVKATPLGTGKEIVLWPEYAITNDRYFDVHMSLTSLKTQGPNFLLTLGWGGALSYRGQEIPGTTCSQTLIADINSNTFNSYTLAHLGCIAKAKNTFLVVNILMRPRDWGVFTYRLKNVNIILAPDGSIVQVYEKIRPVPAEIIYVQPGVVGQPAQVVTLNGVKFVTMICFDLIFPEAGYKIKEKNFLFTTEWTSARDMVSVAFQQGFSRATRSKFYAANINFPDKKGPQQTTTHIDTGSGLFVAGRPLSYFFGSLGQDTYKVQTAPFDDQAPIVPAFDDDVDIHASTLVDGVKPARGAGRQTKLICIGTGCGPVKADKKITAAHVGSNEDTITLTVGELSCTLSLQVHTLPVEATNLYVFQVDHSQSGDSFFNSKNRYVRSCVFVSTFGDEATALKPASWSNYKFFDYSTKFSKVAIKGNNLAKNVAVIPSIALKGASADNSVKPMPANPDSGSLSASSTWSSWKKKDGSNTELLVKNTEDPIRSVSLYGVYQNF